MRILIITQFYPPEPSAIPNDLAKGMKKLGHDVEVITGFPNYPEGKIYPGYKQRLYQYCELDGIKVLRLPLYPDHSLSTTKRALSYLSFAFMATVFCPFLIKKPDVIFVYHTLTSGIPAWWYGFLYKVPFVFNVQDLYPDSFSVVNIAKKSIPYRLAQCLANFVYSKAGALSVISNGFKNNLVERGVFPEKIEIIHSWVDEENYHPEERDNNFADKFKLNNHFNIIFTGGIGPAQGINNIIEAAALLIDIKELQFVLVGEGNSKNLLLDEVTARGLTNVVFLPRQPSELMPKFYACADALLVSLKNDLLFRSTIPYKTFGYLASGRPIIMYAEGDAAALIEKAQAGLVVSPVDPENLAKVLRKFYNMSQSQRLVFGKNGREYYLQNLAINVAMDKYEKLFERVVKWYKK
ncbi:MAG: glycosyltransferase family 4 protein [Gammaproteobacteria bacterium]|nr:glycosyltransferase family 4 protein [Gammaproteobacteria bacterium]